MRRGLEGNVTISTELKALKWLDLSYNNFHGLIQPTFGNLSELEFLDLSSNKLGNSMNCSRKRMTGVCPMDPNSMVMHSKMVKGGPDP